MSKKQVSDLVSRAAWTFVQGFVVTFATLAPGILQVPNLPEARAFVVATVLASLMAGLSALKTFIKETM